MSLRLRVLKTWQVRRVETRNGPRRLSRALVEDMDGGRIMLTLWGRHAGSVRPGDVIEVEGAFTTEYKGRVQLNVGGRGNVRVVERG